MNHDVVVAPQPSVILQLTVSLLLSTQEYRLALSSCEEARLHLSPRTCRIRTRHGTARHQHDPEDTLRNRPALTRPSPPCSTLR